MVENEELLNAPKISNIREINIYPDHDELMKTDDEIYLRPIIVKGAYNNMDHYIDVLFRLTREDYMRPLRQGVQNHISENPGRVSEVHLYKDLRIGPPETSRSGIVWTIYFDQSKHNWQGSKRLIFGSLLLISHDNFSSNGMLVATVVDNDRRKKGEIMIQLFRGNLNPRLTYKMLESSAYFEPYNRILRRIQDPEFKNMPFQQYLVRQLKNDTEVLQHQPNLARYLRNQEAVYDLTALMKPEYLNWDENLGKGIHILNEHWTNEEYMALNGSQLKAVKSALSHELSVIQGPPGTGKTYVALKVVKCLLDNSKFWYGDRGCPILVVCYTNHALDHFLEGIVPMVPEKIVRIGAQSKSEILQPVNLSKLTPFFRTHTLFYHKYGSRVYLFLHHFFCLFTQFFLFKKIVC